jgi:two-component system KDP operon response regulator KdpE
MAIGTAYYPLSYPPSESRVPGKSNLPEARLLIVGEEARERRALHLALYGLGFDVGEAISGEEATALCRLVDYDAVLLDVNVLGGGGIETLVELRSVRPQGAIFVLSVEGDPERKVEALDAGADDYLTKPIYMPELAARIRAALRWAVPAAVRKEQVIVIGEVSLNSARHLVEKAGRRVHLTPMEFEFLRCLMMHPGLPIPRRRLLQVLWGDGSLNRTDCLRTMVCQLRKKLEDDPGAPRYVLTESYIGYRFAEQEELALSGNLDAFVSRRHRFPFSVPNHHPHDVAAQRHVEDFFDRDSGTL